MRKKRKLPNAESLLSNQHEIFPSEDGDENPISLILGRCTIKHEEEVLRKDGLSLEEYCKEAHHYYYSYSYDSEKKELKREDYGGDQNHENNNNNNTDYKKNDTCNNSILTIPKDINSSSNNNNNYRKNSPPRIEKHNEVLSLVAHELFPAVTDLSDNSTGT